MVSNTTLKSHCFHISGQRSKPSRPPNAIEMKMAESIACPTMVEPIVRVQRKRPSVARFSRMSTIAFANSPARKAAKLPATIRHVCPRIAS